MRSRPAFAAASAVASHRGDRARSAFRSERPCRPRRLFARAGPGALREGRGRARRSRRDLVAASGSMARDAEAPGEFGTARAVSRSATAARAPRPASVRTWFCPHCPQPITAIRGVMKGSLSTARPRLRLDRTSFVPPKERCRKTVAASHPGLRATRPSEVELRRPRASGMFAPRPDPGDVRRPAAARPDAASSRTPAPPGNRPDDPSPPHLRLDSSAPPHLYPPGLSAIDRPRSRGGVAQLVRAAES